MFKYFKEMRELKLAKLRGEVIILTTICKLIDGYPDLVEVAKKLSNVDQLDVAKELINHMKANEEKVSE